MTSDPSLPPTDRGGWEGSTVQEVACGGRAGEHRRFRALRFTPGGAGAHQGLLQEPEDGCAQVRVGPTCRRVSKPLPHLPLLCRLPFTA